MKLPSKNQIGDEVFFTVSDENVGAKVIAVHFTINKVRYDLELKTKDDSVTRIYNVDSCYVNAVLS